MRIHSIYILLCTILLYTTYTQFFIYLIYYTTDGVINGNYRSSLAGCDLNRKWKTPDPVRHIEIYSTKELIKYIKLRYNISLLVDLHGHSNKKDIFVYGCVANPTIAKRYFPRLVTIPLATKPMNSGGGGGSGDRSGGQGVIGNSNNSSSSSRKSSVRGSVRSSSIVPVSHSHMTSVKSASSLPDQQQLTLTARSGTPRIEEEGDLSLPNGDLNLPNTDLSLPNTDLSLPNTGLNLPNADLSQPNTYPALTPDLEAVSDPVSARTDTLPPQDISRPDSPASVILDIRSTVTSTKSEASLSWTQEQRHSTITSTLKPSPRDDTAPPIVNYSVNNTPASYTNPYNNTVPTLDELMKWRILLFPTLLNRLSPVFSLDNCRYTPTHICFYP